MTDWTNVNRDSEADNYDMITSVGIKIHQTTGIPTDFTEFNRAYLKGHLDMVKPCSCILEIGVDNNPDKTTTSTNTLLKYKNDSTIYIGVDIQDRKYLDNPDKNIYTIQTRSENIQEVMNFARSKGVEKIDYFFIDGWHSINQCIIEFYGYAPYLSDKAIVGFHDTNHHHGPKWLTEMLDWNVWELANYPSDPTMDYGIGFVWKKENNGIYRKIS